jgi:putative transposase
VVTPRQRREAVAYVKETRAVSERRACSALGIGRSLVRYRFRREPDAALREKLRELAAKRRRFGYRRLAVMLRREGFACNVKKVRRIYREENLMVKRRKGRKKAVGTRQPLPVADSVGQVWSLDFMSDAFTDGRRFRLLAVMDQCSRECLTAVADTSMPGLRVVRELDVLVALHGKPKVIVSDNGPELTSRAVLIWAAENDIDWHYIDPGKPQQNGYTESLNGKIRDEFLDDNWFGNLAEVRALLEEWRQDYNAVRPHSSLGYMTPHEYLQQLAAKNFAEGHAPLQSIDGRWSPVYNAGMTLPEDGPK